MIAETEFAIFDIKREELWNVFVELPWAYKIIDNTIRLNIMGTVIYKDLISGKQLKE